MKPNQLISNQTIADMKPCSDRHENYLKHYKGEVHSLRVFLSLEEITYNDKTWVLSKLLTKNQSVRWAIMCAESVLGIFEKRYPENKAPRKVIDYLKSLDSYESLTEKQIQTIRQLRHDATAAAYAAADAADAAADAAYAAAAAAAAYAADARKEQQATNLQLLVMVIESSEGN